MMYSRSRALCVSALLVLTSALAGAQTFTYSVACSQVTIGPVTVLAYNSGPQTVALTPGSTLITALLPVNNSTRIDNNAAPPASFGGTLACNMTFSGIPVAFSRSLALTTSPGQMTIGATSFNVNLGLQGTVNFSVPSDVTIGFDSSQPNGTVLTIPLIADTSILLTGLAAPTGVPMSPWSLATVFVGLVGLGWYAMRQGL